jgi:molecular chaperone GrpE
MADAKEPQSSELQPEVNGVASAAADDRPQFSVNDKRFWAAREREDSGEEGGTTATTTRMPTYLENLQEQLQEKDRLLKAHIAETRSEQEELRRRLARELEQRLELATGHLLADFLPVLDNLDRALQAAEQHPNPNIDALLEGLHLVRTQFLNALGRHGLKPLDRQGEPFDPSLDEAMTTVEVSDPRQQNLVLQEWEKGYTLHGKVLRPAKVAVGKLLAEDQ